MELALRFSEVELCVNKQQEDMKKKMCVDFCRCDNTVITQYDRMEHYGLIIICDHTSFTAFK